MPSSQSKDGGTRMLRHIKKWIKHHKLATVVIVRAIIFTVRRVTVWRKHSFLQ